MTNTQICLKYKTSTGRERTIKSENWTEKDTTGVTSAASTQRPSTDELQAVYPAPPEPAPQPVTEPASWKRFRLVEESVSNYYYLYLRLVLALVPYTKLVSGLTI
ncbi:uncharacterized protein LOC128546325 [Mercenaria mercenaria]|uniref:uncharacterized protein LOC128546325 n=1 Tax=Mercenaria mercenaria TaxID=6596 RepID=UPI00234EDEE5|nr:uncharacterized protein LOC128546325 [Mercenaria mercenaria]